MDRSIRRLSRSRTGRSVPLLAIAALTAAVAMAAGGAPAVADVSSPVPVVGVTTFGIGAGQLATPNGLALDAAGNLFVTDIPAHRVLRYARAADGTYAKTGIVVAGTGVQGSGLNQLSNPSGIVVDPRGNVFVSDNLNNRVLEFAYSSSTDSYASSGIVVAGTGGTGAGLNQLSSPMGIALDGKGNLYVADANNHRVLEFVVDTTARFATSGVLVGGTGVAGNASNQLRGPRAVALSAGG